MDWLALHGVPVGPKTWSKLSIPLNSPGFQGLATAEERQDWTLRGFVDEVAPLAEGKIVIGQDLGGVVAAMLALEVSVKAVVLTGTALGPWWAMTRLSAHPLVSSFFYRRFEGRLFARLGQSLGTGSSALTPDLSGLSFANRMQELAINMTPPKKLAKRLRDETPVFLIWGKRDVFYPAPVAMALSHAMAAPIHWMKGGHYCMWEQPVAFSEAMSLIADSLVQT